MRLYGEGFQVAVSDSGIGISAGEQADIFKPRVRGTNTRGITGKGLGLAIAKEIIDGHGGRIWVESQENVGSTFHFVIPGFM